MKQYETKVSEMSVDPDCLITKKESYVTFEITDREVNSNEERACVLQNLANANLNERTSEGAEDDSNSNDKVVQVNQYSSSEMEKPNRLAELLKSSDNGQESSHSGSQALGGSTQSDGQDQELLNQLKEINNLEKQLHLYARSNAPPGKAAQTSQAGESDDAHLHKRLMLKVKKKNQSSAEQVPLSSKQQSSTQCSCRSQLLKTSELEELNLLAGEEQDQGHAKGPLQQTQQFQVPQWQQAQQPQQWQKTQQWQPAESERGKKEPSFQAQPLSSSFEGKSLTNQETDEDNNTSLADRPGATILDSDAEKEGARPEAQKNVGVDEFLEQILVSKKRIKEKIKSLVQKDLENSRLPAQTKNYLELLINDIKSKLNYIDIYRLDIQKIQSLNTEKSVVADFFRKMKQQIDVQQIEINRNLETVQNILNNN